MVRDDDDGHRESLRVLGPDGFRVINGDDRLRERCSDRLDSGDGDLQRNPARFIPGVSRFGAVVKRDGVLPRDRATVDLGVTSFEASLRRKGAIRAELSQLWLTIDGPYGQSGIHFEAVGDDLAQVIADYMIDDAANFSGVQIPTRPTRAE